MTAPVIATIDRDVADLRELAGIAAEAEARALRASAAMERVMTQMIALRDAYDAAHGAMQAWLSTSEAAWRVIARIADRRHEAQQRREDAIVAEIDAREAAHLGGAQ